MILFRRYPRFWIVLTALLLVGGILFYRHWRYGVPHLSYTSGRTPDELLPPLQEPHPGVSLLATNVDDFPGFLGAGRRGAVDTFALDPDWSAHPPRQVWRQPIGGGWSAFSVVNGFAVTMEQRGELAQVSCYSVETGLHHWSASWNERFSNNGVGPRSTPSIDGGRVYAVGAWGHLVCIEGSTGRVLWEHEVVKELGMQWREESRAVRFGRAGSPLVAGNLVIVPGGGLSGKRASLLAFDAATGRLRWRGGDRQISYSSPVLADMLGERQVLIVNEDSVSGHALNTGEELWSYPWPGDSGADASVSQPVQLTTNRILLTKGYRRGASVIELRRDAEGTRMQPRCLWSNGAVLNTKFTNVAVWNGHAYGLSDGVLECVELETGKRRWKEGRYGDGQILRVRELLLVLSEKGELVLVRLDSGQPGAVLGRVQALTGTTWNNIALYGRYLLLRNATEAVCYELTRAGGL